jgi:XTP/dITP diphosphohydrolase
VNAIYLASGNEHKACEFQAMAEQAQLAVSIRPAQAIGGMPPVPEDTGTFLGNARQKARALQPRLPPTGAWVLADDSGLCVDALGGEPGVDSAIYAGPAGDSVANLAKLVRAMRDVPESERAAHFMCVLVLAAADGTLRVFTGRCDGRLLLAPRGRNGFGYDPLFVPSGYELSFAELDGAQKNTLSHRARAWEQLVGYLNNPRRFSASTEE